MDVEVSVDVPLGVELDYRVSEDSGEVFLNVFHFRVCEDVRGEGKASEVLDSLIESCEEHGIARLNVVMQVPESEEEKVLYLFREKFGFDIVEYPVEKPRYDTSLVDAVMFF
jgi:N-acetylglutamate synthase-like GNAT family acetyltransferase